jgi:hypothetical protein
MWDLAERPEAVAPRVSLQFRKGDRPGKSFSGHAAYWKIQGCTARERQNT